MKKKFEKLYNRLVKTKEMQCDIVSTDGKKMSIEERKKIVKVWDLLDDSLLIVHNLINKR